MVDIVEESERGQLEKEIRISFGEDGLEKLRKWYESMLDSKFSYVVFIVRRSYLLALIMEKITGKKLEQSSEARFLTDASFFFHCKKLSEYYKKNHKFPRVLIVEDVLLHGRNINRLIENMEIELCKLLPDYDVSMIKRDLAKSLDIHVLARTKGRLLLDPLYERNLEYKYMEDAKFLHKFSSTLSTIVLYSGSANASYIFSEFISNEEIDKLTQEDFMKMSYQNIEEMIHIQYVGTEKRKKAVFTLRVIKNLNGNGYRVIPFIFLPNLSQKQTMEICTVILDKIGNAKYRDWIMRLEEMKGKRSFNELISLILSNVLLQEFNKKYLIRINENDKEEEITKLARNYDEVGFENTRKMLKEILDVSFFNVKELTKLVEQCITDEFEVLELSVKSKSKVDKDVIKKRIEDYFYYRGQQDEKRAYDLLQKSDHNVTRPAQRSVRGCCFTLKELNTGYTQEESKYCIAYFLQMMDAGVLSLSSYASEKVKVVGYAQFVKAGEQSLLLRMLEIYEYIPMLVQIQKECEFRGQDTKEEVRRYIFKEGLRSNVDRIIEFIDGVEQVGEKIADWDENYMFLIEKIQGDTMEKIRKICEYNNLQQKYKENYIKYRHNS